MPLILDEGAEGDGGEWFTFPQKDVSPETKPVRLKIRAIPDAEGRAIHRRHFGRKKELKTDKDGNQVSSYDADAGVKNIVDRASYALVESEGLGIHVGDASAAEVYTQLLGSPVKAGEDVTLDGRLSDPIKARILERHTSLAMWILSKSEKLGLQIVEEEAAEGKG